MGWLIAYDIACPRRWRRVYRLMTETSVPVQYSLFYTDLPAPAFRALWTALARTIDHGEDDVRAYPVDARTRAWFAGRGLPPEGVALLGDSFATLVERGWQDVPEAWHEPPPRSRRTR